MRDIAKNKTDVVPTETNMWGNLRNGQLTDLLDTGIPSHSRVMHNQLHLWLSISGHQDTAYQILSLFPLKSATVQI